MPVFFKNKRWVHSLAIIAVGIAVACGIYFPNTPFALSVWPLPFEGTITNVEYNCLCSLSILLTVQPSAATAQEGQVTKQLLLVWGAQLLEAITKKFGFELPGGAPLIIPRTYLWCQVFYAGNQRLLGNYIPGAFPCYEFVGPPDWCRFKMNAEGAIFNVGTSAF
jgi:hypothetical protein